MKETKRNKEQVTLIVKQLVERLQFKCRELDKRIEYQDYVIQKYGYAIGWLIFFLTLCVVGLIVTAASALYVALGFVGL